MDYKEKYEKANQTLMEIITVLIVYHMTHASGHCIKEIDSIVRPYALLKRTEFEQEIKGVNKQEKEN